MLVCLLLRVHPPGNNRKFPALGELYNVLLSESPRDAHMQTLATANHLCLQNGEEGYATFCTSGTMCAVTCNDCLYTL